MSKILLNMVEEMFDDVFIHEFTYWIDGGKGPNRDRSAMIAHFEIQVVLFL